ncbi:rhodanese-like domain-containing protein [Ignavibacteriales bacterium]
MLRNLFFGSSKVKNLSANEFHDAFKGDANSVVLDVRTAGEVSGGYIPGAKNIDLMSPGFANQIEKLDKNKSYYIYCRSGSRSYQAGMIMAKAGFEKVFNLSGGIMSWKFEIKR